MAGKHINHVDSSCSPHLQAATTVDSKVATLKKRDQGQLKRIVDLVWKKRTYERWAEMEVKGTTESEQLGESKGEVHSAKEQNRGKDDSWLAMINIMSNQIYVILTDIIRRICNPVLVTLVL